MSWIKNFLFGVCFIATSSAYAQDIVILGLFKNKVVIKKDGKRMVLKTGDVTPDGLEVHSVNSKQAVISLHGKKDFYELGMQISASFAPPQLATVKIPRDDHGMYRVKGKINQMPIDFLVDTGASMLALNANQAKALGIPYKEGQLTMVETASGQAPAYRVQLNKVSLGQIEIKNVDALIVDGSSPKEALLGMSFLKHLEMENSSSVMMLQQRF